MSIFLKRCAVAAALLFVFQVSANAQERSTAERVVRTVVVVVGGTAKVTGEAVAVTAPVVYKITEKAVKLSAPVVIKVGGTAVNAALRTAGGLLKVAVPAGRKLLVTYLKAKLPL